MFQFILVLKHTKTMYLRWSESKGQCLKMT